MRRTIGSAWIVALLALTAPVRAEECPWHLDLEALTDFPVGVGGRLALHMPYGLRTSFSAQVLPSGYVDAINGILVGVGAYSASTAELIASTLDDSLVLRAHVGWRPLADYGFYIDVGYGYLGLGGSTAGGALLSGILGVPLPQARVAAQARDFDAASDVHMVDVEVGYEWAFWNALVVRVALGFAGTVAADAAVRAKFEVVRTFELSIAEFERYAEDYLEETFTSYVFTPVVTVAVGYRFF